MREDQIDQAERRATLDNDRKVLEQQGSTFFQHSQAQADEVNQGRFAATGAPQVIGSTAASLRYPQLPTASPWSGAQPEPGIEPPLGLDNPAIDNSAGVSLSELQPAAPGGAEAPSSLSPDVEPAPPLSSTERDDA